MTDKSIPKILVAGIGNIFKGDDGFGVEVARRLASRALPASVDLVDFGIRGLDLAYTLLDGAHDRVVLIDVVRRGGDPGTIYVIEPRLDDPDSNTDEIVAETHGMHPAQVLRWVKTMGGRLAYVRLVGCEPADLGADNEVKVGLSAAVARSVEHAVRAVEELVTKLISEAPCTS